MSISNNSRTNIKFINTINRVVVDFKLCLSVKGDNIARSKKSAIKNTNNTTSLSMT
jgi:hypothetical protein